MIGGLAGPGVRAVLIGTGTHVAGSVLTNVPAVADTLNDLGRVLVDRCGLAEENLLIIRDPSGPKEVLVAVREAGAQADDVLMVVYIGHGLLSRESALYLATSGTSTLDVAIADHQAVRYSALAAAVGNSHARSTVVVLDCCFSGRADPPNRHGYLLTSASGEELALAPVGQRYTAFTGKMIELLRDGDPGAPPHITLDHLYRYQWRVQAELRCTTPRRQVGDLSGDLVLATNPAYVPVSQRVRSTPELSGDMCPYLGFSAYTAQDERYFRGRATLTNDLVRRAATRLWQHRPLVVIGPSGAGKTSLLHAGLLPAIGRGELGVPRSGGWPRIALRPGSTPLATLTVRVAEAVGCDATTVTEHPESIAGLLRKTTDTRLVLVVDQFEQLFTLGADEAERAAFVSLLAALARGCDGDPAAAVVVLGVRADFYDHCALFPELVEALQDTVIVGPMNTDELRAAIVEPAELVGLEVGQELVDLLLREIDADRPGGHEVGRLPLLSHALQSTWGQQERRVLTADGYVRTGGIAGAVERTGEQVYEAFAESERDCVRLVLLAMVLINADTPDVVRRVGVPDLLAGLPDADVGRRVLDTLADARLVTVDGDSVEITHEVLLRSWPRLREWIDADRDWLRIRQRIMADAQAWHDSARDISLLYRGANLVTARTDTRGSGRAQQLGTIGNDFLTASARQARRGQLLRRGFLALLVVLTVVAASTAGFSLTQRSAALAERATAEQQRNLAVSRELATRSETIGDEDPKLADLLSVAAWRIAPTQEARAAMLRSVTRPAVAALDVGGLTAPTIAFTPNGTAVVLSDDDTVTRWNAVDGTQLGRATTVGSGAIAAALSRDGSMLAVGGEPANPQSLQIWNLISGKEIRTINDGVVLTGINDDLVFSPDGKQLAGLSTNAGTVSVWNVATGALAARLPLGDLAGTKAALAFGPNGILVASPNAAPRHIPAQGGVLVWHISATTPTPIALAEGQDTVTALAVNATGDTVATATDTGVVRQWSVATGKPLGTPFTNGGTEIDALAFSPDDATVAAGGVDKAVYLWHTADLQPAGSPLVGQRGPISHLVFGPDGRTLAVAGFGGTVRLWQPFGRSAVATLTGHTGPVNSVAFGTEPTLASGGQDAVVRLWNTTAHKASGWSRSDPFGSPVNQIAFSPDGSMIAFGDDHGYTQLSHRTDNINPDLMLLHPTNDDVTAVASLAFSRDGRILATVTGCASGTSCAQNNLRLWDTTTGRQYEPLPQPIGLAPDDFTAVAFSPTRDVVVGARSLSLVWWNTATRQVMFGSDGVIGTFLLVLFSPDGKTVIAADSQDNIDVFDANTGRLKDTLAVAAGGGTSLAMSPDGALLAVGTVNGMVRLYDTSDYQPAGAALVTQSTVRSVAFNRTGRQLAAGLQNGAVQLWDIAYTTDTAAAVCAKAGRSLSKEEWNTEIPAGPGYQHICP